MAVPAVDRARFAGRARRRVATAAETEAHGSDIVGMIARAVNFAIFAGTLFYFLQSPIRTYLAGRSGQIRSDLVNAAEMRQSAAAHLLPTNLANQTPS